MVVTIYEAKFIKNNFSEHTYLKRLKSIEMVLVEPESSASGCGILVFSTLKLTSMLKYALHIN